MKSLLKQRNNLFCDGWKFTKQRSDMTYEEMQVLSVDNWYDVDIPHDWLIYDTKKLYENSSGWYKKIFEIDTIDNTVYNLYFEGVYMDSTVYVNGNFAGEWKYGYSSFEFDITEYLKKGSNIVIVKAVYISPNTRWYSGAGVYRNVWLKKTSLTYLKSDGIYISCKNMGDNWKVEIDSEIANKDKKCNITIKQVIWDNKGNKAWIAEAEFESEENSETVCKNQSLYVECPQLWNIDSPYLYTLNTYIEKDGKVIDEITQKFGFREFSFDKEEGFFLNGNYIKIHGVCEHHDLGALGAAFNKVAMKRKFDILKEMGVNALRTSHNMPAPEVMELADEMGIVVISEAFDMWELPKTTYDYAKFFKEWYKKDVASWIRRDRNHPSLIMWSIGNEIYDTHKNERGLEVTKMLCSEVMGYDSRRNAVITIGSNYMAWENAQKCASVVDAVGYNYGERLYEDHHKKYPDWVIYGSETASTVQSRGIYHFPADETVLTYEDMQCSSLDNCSTGWGAKSTQAVITDDRDAKFCLGQFIWTGFDYIGEPTPYSTKNSYFGQIDTAGFKKDSFFLFQAEWTDYKKAPMVHLLPRWDFNPGQLIDVRVYSNAPKTELFLNEESLGIFNIDHKSGKQLSGEWQVPYCPGELKAVAYDENGNIIATDIKCSYGDAKKIILKTENKILKANGIDLIFIEISAVDENGTEVENANNRMDVSVTGAGRLIGLDNGDSTDYDQYKGTSRKLFNGKLLAIIAAKEEAGEIYVSVSSKDLEGTNITLKATEADKISGICAKTKNRNIEYTDEIPVRKIQLICNESNNLSKENPKAVVSYKIYPKNAIYGKLCWTAVTNAGVITNIVEIEEGNQNVIVHAKGDGNFRLRCCCTNGKNHTDIISELEFDVKGMGSAVIDPYGFVFSALYNDGSVNFKNGKDGGVIVYGDTVPVYIGFHNLDFGKGIKGSDEIELPVMYMNGERLPLELWDGVPGEGELLLKTEYKAKPRWNTYIENVFKLPVKMEGIKNLYVKFTEISGRIDFKGFKFLQPDSAYEKYPAVKNIRIYGDSFEIKEDAIEKIGNNVFIEFGTMNFGEKGPGSIEICGRSDIEKNSIRLIFHGAEGENIKVIEFPYSAEYSVKQFPLNEIKGVQKINFAFMPGSKFNFKWFKFMK